MTEGRRSYTPTFELALTLKIHDAASVAHLQPSGTVWEMSPVITF
jgi:hypothetical protein